jgi:hypothetical protein
MQREHILKAYLYESHTSVSLYVNSIQLLRNGSVKKNRTAQNDNQLIRDLFTQPEIGRRLNRMWPEDLIR